MITLGRLTVCVAVFGLVTLLTLVGLRGAARARTRAVHAGWCEDELQAEECTALLLRGDLGPQEGFFTKNVISEGTSRASLPYLMAHTA